MDHLFTYLDYQLFLRDFYETRKRESSFFSYRFMGQKLGLDPGFLVKVLQGKMHLALWSIPAFCEFLKFTPRESGFFDALVQYNRATDPREIKKRFEKILSFREVPTQKLRADQYEFYQKWYYSAIRELLAFYDMRDNYAALGSILSPAIGAREAKNAVKLLIGLGLAKRDKAGRLRQQEPFVTTGEQWQSTAIRTFQQETIRLSGESIDRHPPQQRDISTITVAVSHKDLAEIRERARQFRQSIFNIKNDNPADCVYQINIQVIPLTNLKGVGDGT